MAIAPAPTATTTMAATKKRSLHRFPRRKLNIGHDDSNAFAPKPAATERVPATTQQSPIIAEAEAEVEYPAAMAEAAIVEAEAKYPTAMAELEAKRRRRWTSDTPWRRRPRP